MWWAEVTKENHRYIVGPFNDEIEARQKAAKYNAPFKLHDLPTTDEGRATRMLKAKYSSIERIGHGVRTAVL